MPPAILALALLTPMRWAVPALLMLGSVATLHLGVLCYRLRAFRRRFRLEIAVMAALGAMAIVAAVAGLLAPAPLGWDGFARVYGILIALGFLLAGWLLLAVPDLVPKAREAVATAYAQSTLVGSIALPRWKSWVKDNGLGGAEPLLQESNDAAAR